MANDIHLLAIENWTKLAKSVDFNTITTTLNSSTSYTASDSTSGLSLNVVGTGFTPESPFPPYILLASGTITGFTLSLHGKKIVQGSDYSIPAGQLSSALEDAVLEDKPSVFFNFWFQFGATVSGTAPIVEGNLENLLREYVHITAIILTNASPVIQLTAAEEKADKGLLAKITSAYILDVHNADGSWTTTGHGNDLKIHDKPSVDTITGGGSGEDFLFKAGFGSATLTDFHDHLTGSTHDTVTLPSSEFGSFTELLNKEATKSGTSVLISSGTDHLTLEDMKLSQLVSTDFKFV
jgi:hypothetical protein